MNYSKFDHIDSEDDEPDAATAAANERRQLQVAADVIPGPLRMALGKMHIALDRGDEEEATAHRNSMGQLIMKLPESDRPKVMAAIQSVVVGGAKAQAAANAKQETASVVQKPAPATQKPAPATQKPAPATQKPAPAKQAQAPVDAGGTDSLEGALETAREQLPRALSELEAAQKELAALDPRDMRGLLAWMHKMGVSPKDMEAAAKADDPRVALQELAESVFKAKHEKITKQAMTIPGAVETTPNAAAQIMALQKEREAAAKRVEEAAPARQTEVAAKRAELMARDDATKREQSEQKPSKQPSDEDQGPQAVSAAHAAAVVPEAAAAPPVVIEDPDTAAASASRFDLSEVDGAMMLLVHLPASVTSMAQLGVDVGSDLVVVDVDGECYARVPMARGVDETTAKAKFDKKRKVLRISAAFA